RAMGVRLPRPNARPGLALTDLSHRRHQRRVLMRSSLGTLPLLVLASGCVDLPAYSLVEDLRILAVRADPPQLLDSPVASEVRFDALVVDPRAPDEPIELSWQFCPVNG